MTTSGPAPTATVSRSCSELDPEEWDSICGSNPFARHGWLALLESIRRDPPACYVEVREAGVLVAGAVFHPQVDFRTSAASLPRIGRRVMRRVLDVRPPFVCAVPGLAQHGLALADPHHARERCALILSAMAASSDSSKAPFFAFSDLPRDELDVLNASETAFVQELPPDAVLGIRWTTFDDYLADQPRKNRAKIRNYRRRSSESGVQLSIDSVAATASSASAGPAVERLITGIEEHHSNAPAHHRNFLARASQFDVIRDARVITATLGGSMIACGTVLVSGDAAMLRWFGLDHARARDVFAYHYVLTETVQQAIDMGVRRLSLGPTTYPVKRHLGADLEPRYGAIFPNGMITRGALRGLSAIRERRAP